jgi:2-oxoglutarate dehydrogenase E2 component (dihydrolipoamide succinyltransferase)
MSVEIRVPVLGESVVEATVAQWFKATGEAVDVDEPLVELETDKVTIEVPAPAGGTLTEIRAGTGENVEPGAVLGVIDEAAAAKKAAAKPAAEPAAPAPAEPERPPTAPAPEKAVKAAPPAAAERPLSPAVRRLVAESRLDPAAIPATGKDGRLTKGDVLMALEGAAAAPEPAPPPSPAPEPAAPAPAPAAPSPEAGREERVRMTRLRRRIAERLKEAQSTAAILTTFNDVDMSSVIALRKNYRDAFEKKHGARLGFMSFFIKAVVVALKELPVVNAEIDGDDLVYKNYYHIGVAVGSPQGLVVPVVRDADRLSFAEIEKAVAELAGKARDGQLALADLMGGTFTITNGGIYGSLLSTPILNPPQAAILGMHKIQERAMVVDGRVEARPMMYLALSYDHRIIDGREAVTFLVRIKECIEDPERLMLDV